MRTPTAKRVIVYMTTCFFAFIGHAQTIFSYGNHSINKEEFLKAYSKNNLDGKPTDKSYQDYLQLYIRYKLKVQAAYDLHMDTLPSQTKELKSFRNQVADTYMTDQESLNKLVNEAFDRSRKDVHLAHIYIALPKNPSPADTLKAFQKAMKAYEELKKGKTFAEVAVAYSEDPSAKDNKGDIGFITVFTLPYELETLAYTTPESKFSKPYRSAVGYHIFKNLGERKAIGKITAAHILFSFPPNASDEWKAKQKLKADSVYQALENGANFGEMAKIYSGDNLTYMNGGTLSDFSVGKYEPSFEEAAFALSKDGDISRPLLTGYGYHIIKRISRKPIPEKSKESLSDIKMRVLSDPRIKISTNQFLNKIYTLTHFQILPINRSNLWVYTDSAQQYKALPKFANLDNNTLLFRCDQKAVTVKDWVEYIRNLKAKSAASANKSDEQIFQQFKESSAISYYRDNLEKYNPDFAYQLNEFKEGNLLFEVMQRNIWDKAAIDTVGLRNYFEGHKDNYQWKPGADAIIFNCSNQASAEKTKTQLQGNISDWRKWADNSGGTVQADSGRFEKAQIPKTDIKLTANEFTSFNVTPPDNSVSFAYIIRLQNEKTPRNFNEARGFVMNDYQVFLEDNWINQLKEKYPVKINEELVKKLPK